MAGARLLVVDDSPTIRKLVELTLRDSSWSVSFAASGREGIAAALAAPPDLVVLDFVLPDMRGIDVCKRLASEPATRAVPILVVTAKGDEVRSLFEPFDSVLAYLPKPFTADQLRRATAAALVERPAAPGAFTREQAEAAAKILFARFRGAFASVPQWCAELGAAPPAAFFARKLLTPDRVAAILEALAPICRTSPEAPAVASVEGAAMQGELRGWPLGDVLGFFGASGRTGELSITYGDRTTLLYWRRGEIILVTTRDPDRYLRGALIGRVEPAQLARAMAEQRVSAKPVFVSLAEDGAALGASLGDLLQRQGRRLLLEAIDATSASFAWRDHGALPLYVEAHGRHVSTARNTLVFGLTGHGAAPPLRSSLDQMTLERLRGETPVGSAIARGAVLDRARGFSARVLRFDLDPSERRVLAAIDGVLPLTDVATRASLPVEEVRAVAARLREVGLVEERAFARGGEERASITGASGGRAARSRADESSGNRPVLILEPDIDGFQRPLEALLRARAADIPVLSLASERDIVAAIHREHPRLVILNAASAGGIADTARAVRASRELADVSLVAVLDTERDVDAASLQAAGFDAVFVKPVPYADLERLLD